MGSVTQRRRSEPDGKFRGDPVGRIRRALSTAQLRQLQNGALMDVYAAALQWAHADIAYQRLIRSDREVSTADASAVQEWARQELLRYVLAAHREYEEMAVATAVLRAAGGARPAQRSERRQMEEPQEPIDCLEHQS